MTNEEFEQFLKDNPPSLNSAAFFFQNFGDAETCQRLVDTVNPLIGFTSCLIPLATLDGITIAADYRQALLNLNRGVKTSEVLEPTTETFGIGMAMASAVIREGKLKTHVTIDANLARGLISDDPSFAELAKHTLIYELGHVAEHALADAAFDSALLRPLPDRYEQALFRHAHSAWGEYYASRISATRGPNALAGFRELVVGALEQLKTRVTDARAGLNFLTLDRNRKAAEVIVAEIASVMKYSGYLLGHAAGNDESPFEDGDTVAALLAELDLESWFRTLGDRLEVLFQSRGEWTEVSAFFSLHRSLEEAALKFKLALHRTDQYDLGWRIYF